MEARQDASRSLPCLRVALVDDHPVVREGLRALMELDFGIAVVAEFEDADSVTTALPDLEAMQLDVMVLDLELPGNSGLKLLRCVLNRCPRLHVVMFSMHDSAYLIKYCLRTGAAGYITKTNDPALVVDAVHRCSTGEIVLSPDLMSVLPGA